MQRFIILHTNDIHARIEGLARIATLVEQIRAENASTPVLYFDAGDIEDNSIRLSSLTKGVAMHRLLSVSGCDAAVVGNGGIGSYGHQMLPEYSKAADYPLLLANLYTAEGKLVPGVQPTALLNVGTLRLGLIGVTAPIVDIYGEDGFGLQLPTLLPLIKECATRLRQDGAQAIILLSHLGLEADPDFAQQRPRPFRDRARGLMHLSGARIEDGQLLVGGQPIELEHYYSVAACDWELSEYGGYVDPQWKLQLHFEMPTILRDVLEAYIPTHSPLHVEMGRLS